MKKDKRKKNRRKKIKRKIYILQKIIKSLLDQHLQQKKKLNMCIETYKRRRSLPCWCL